MERLRAGLSLQRRPLFFQYINKPTSRPCSYSRTPTRATTSPWRPTPRNTPPTTSTAGPDAGSTKRRPVQWPGLSKSKPSAAEKRVLEEKLGEAEMAIKEEQARFEELHLYQVKQPKRGIIGKSRFAQRLRNDIRTAARDPRRKPVLVAGEPGLELDNTASLVHFCSSERRLPMVSVDCVTLGNPCTSPLLHGDGSRRGLLYWLRNGGTLLLNNAHQLPASVLVEFLQQMGSSSKSCDEDAAAGEQASGPRVMLAMEGSSPPELDFLCTAIKVPPLRVRTSDINDMEAFMLRKLARLRGLKSISITRGAVLRLESYSFPWNIRELEGLLERAVSTAFPAFMAGSSSSRRLELDESAFWFASQDKDRGRFNIFQMFPLLRDFLRSDWWPERINKNFTVFAYAFLVAALFVGPQDRMHNFGLSAVWDYWWPLMFVAFPFLGRIWCAVCPFMIVADITQRWRESQGAQLLKWPKEAAEAYGPWFLYALFGGILVWEECWDLPNTAYLTGWLLVLITSGAVACSYFFERRFWCRYLCPVGGMNGMFAKMSMTEMRARQGVCASHCSTYTCFKGGPAVAPDGLDSKGCPGFCHPAQLTDNRNCVMCAECLKACPHGSVELRLRVPGVDLWTTHKPTEAEAALMFMLMGSAALHHMPHLATQLGLDPSLLASLPNAMLASALVLTVPGLLCYGVDWAWQQEPVAQLVGGLLGSTSSAAGTAAAQGRCPGGAAVAPDGKAHVCSSSQAGCAACAQASPQLLAEEEEEAQPRERQPWLDRCYGFLPLAWAAPLAHYLHNMLGEGGSILPVTAATFGMPGEGLPALVVHPAVIAFLQGATLTTGCVASLLLLWKLGEKHPRREQVPQFILTVLLTAELWGMLVGQ